MTVSDPARAYDRLIESSALALDKLPMLRVVFEGFATRFGERLRPFFPATPHFSLNNVASERIGDALDGYEMNAIASVVHVPAWEQRLVIGFDRDFIFTMVEMLFGGDGTEPPTEDIRSFTSIEQHVARHLFEYAAPSLQEAFAPVENARFRFERLETRLDFAAAGRRASPGVVARFVMQAINRGGVMFVIIPQSVLASLRQPLSRVADKTEDDQPDPQWLAQIASGLQQAGVEIHAVLESEDFTLGDLAEVDVGTVLRLPATLRSRVRVESNEQPLFWAYLGESDGMHTLQVDEEISAGMELLNDVLAR